MASSHSVLRTSQPHIHVAGVQCPVCEQDIPHEKAEVVRQRMEARERALSDSLTARLKEQFAQERVQWEASSRARVEKIQQDHATALTSLRSETAQREEAARASGFDKASAASKQQIETLTEANIRLQAAAEEKIVAANNRALHAERAKVEAENAAHDRIKALETGRQLAEAEAKATKENHETILNTRLLEQREAFQKDKDVALLAEQAKTFDERQRLQATVQQLQNQLAKERADVAGEGAELELYEELKAAFEGDRIRRVPKGTAGADVVHEVIENGQLCGKIVYDSKKRQAWKSEYTTKLCEDKIAEGAQHAILSLLKFPADSTKHLAVRDGVILANPARVTVVAQILRDHIVNSHGLRLSQQERVKKQGELYAYITSERFQQHVDSIESQTDKLLEIDVAEQKAHRTVWERRGGLVMALQKAHGNLRADVARIIGTANAAE